MTRILVEFAGLSGTGKSTLIGELCSTYGYPQTQTSRKIRFSQILNLIPFALLYVFKAEPRLRQYARNVLEKTFSISQSFEGTYLLDEGTFSYISHISKQMIAKNGFVLGLSRQAGVQPDCLVLVSCDAATRVGRIRSREQECLDLELDDQANIAKSEKWEENWRASIGRISQAGVAVFHIDTSISTVQAAAETVHNWIYALEEVRKLEQ